MLSQEAQDRIVREVGHAQMMQTQAFTDSMFRGVERPAISMKPRIFPDGNMWCCLYGENLQEGVAGFGETPEKAMSDFDRAIMWEKAGPESNTTRPSKAQKEGK